jgi:hypothetical protein
VTSRVRESRLSAGGRPVGTGVGQFWNCFAQSGCVVCWSESWKDARGEHPSLGFVESAVLECWPVGLGERDRMASPVEMRLVALAPAVLVAPGVVPEEQHCLVDRISLLLEHEFVDGSLVVVVMHRTAVAVATAAEDAIEIVVDYCSSEAHTARSGAAAVLHLMVPADTWTLALAKSGTVMVEAHRIVLA